MTTWLVDTHLHYYPCYQINKWLDSIFVNFQSYINKKIINSDSEQIKFVCFLTERLSENFFEELKSLDAVSNYKVSSINNDYESIVVASPTKQSITIYRGQQLVALEGIEVLALGKKVFDVNPKLPASKIISTINDSGALSVLPWSFGKWHGKRLNTVIDCIMDDNANFFIGDIFGRDNLTGNNFTKIKSQFNKAVLCGSDPLPMNSEEKFAACKVSLIKDSSKDEFTEILSTLRKYDFSTTSIDCLELTQSKLTSSLLRQLRLRISTTRS